VLDINMDEGMLSCHVNETCLTLLLGAGHQYGRGNAGRQGRHGQILQPHLIRARHCQGGSVTAVFRIRDIFVLMRILLFSSVTFKMPTENNLFLCLFLFEGTFTGCGQ
jgi:hypothetical protein